MAGDDAPSRSRGIVILPALLHGTRARGRHTQTRARTVRPAYARARYLPVVSFRGSAAGGWRALDETARRSTAAHWSQLGRLASPGCGAVVRSARACAR